MSILRLCPNSQHIKEFYGGFTGTCTQTSAAMILASADGTPTDHDGVVNLMLSMTHDMITRGNNPETGAAPNGAATVVSMAYELKQRGANIATQVNYGGDRMSFDWISLFRANAGIRPILLQLANAQAITDAYGHAQDGGVHYHAIAVLGIANEGYVVADPNNPNVENTLDTYPLWALSNASPCGLIMLNVKHPPAPSPAPAPSPPAVDAAATTLANLKTALEAVLN